MRREGGLAGFYWKVYIVTVAFIFLTVLGTSLIFRTIIKNTYYRGLEREYRTEAFLLAEIFSKTQKPDIIEKWRVEGNPRITIINENGEVQLDTHYVSFKMKNQLSMPEVKEAIEKGWGRSIRWSEYVGLKMFFVAGYFKFDNAPSMIIRLSIPVYEINQTINKTTSTVVMGGVVIFIIVSLFSLIMIREITYPIMRIADAIRSFSNGNLNIKMPTFRNRELNLLSSELNRMINSITKGRGELNLVKEQTVKILSSMHEGIILVDKKGTVKEANRAAKEILGLQNTNLIGKNIFSLVTSEDLKRGVRSILEGKDKVNGIISVNVPDERRIEFTCTPFGDRTGVVIALHDITRISRLEKIRREFVANVSHELKTPITSVKGFVETLFKMNPIIEDEMSRKFLTIVQKNITRMENIIEDLLTLSKIEAGAIDLPEDKISINSCIYNAVGVIKQKYPDRTINVIGNEYEFMVRGNQHLIELALINLIDNAMKYSCDDVDVILDGNYKKVFVSIKDRGIGIPQNEIEHIFESFYRVDKARSRELGGTGLGLTIVKRIVEAHKGIVKVFSELGKGTIFKVEFPRYVIY